MYHHPFPAIPPLGSPSVNPGSPCRQTPTFEGLLLAMPLYTERIWLGGSINILFSIISLQEEVDT